MIGSFLAADRLSSAWRVRTSELRVRLLATLHGAPLAVTVEPVAGRIRAAAEEHFREVVAKHPRMDPHCRT